MEPNETILLHALYEEYLVPLKRVAAKMGARPEDIEDLVHETFIEYYERYPLDLPAKVKTVMLIRILKSKWVDETRKRHRREVLRIDDPDDRIQIFRALMEGGGMLSVLESEVQDKELYGVVWENVKKMKKNWRDVIILRIIEGLSTKETCEILGISETVCRSRLSRGKKDLQKRLKKAKVFDD